MITLCWKELRENYRWALLLMAALTLAQWYALNQELFSPNYGNNYFLTGVTLCSTSFLTVTTFGCAGAGLLLGLIQILPELRRDRWAALLHRPVSPGVLFRGKVIAGILLYLLATVPPFLYSVWVVATPGHFASPFVPGMTLAGAADICSGLAFYFAAVALALQSGGWIGLRLFPLLAAYYALSFVAANRWFYIAIEGSVLMSLALFTAGWGIMLHREKLAPRPWLARAAFLGVVFYGACALGNFARTALDLALPAPRAISVYYNLSEDGFPIQVIYKNNAVISVTDAGGHALQDKKYQPDQVRNHMIYANTFSNYIGDSHGWRPWWNNRDAYRDTLTYLWPLSISSYPSTEQWFYLCGARSIIGYSGSHKTAVAWFDQAGFQPPTAAPEPFPPDADWSQFGQDYIILSDRASLRLATVPSREIKTLPLPAPGPIYGIGQTWANNKQGNVSVIGAVLPHELAVYDEKGALVTVLPYHHDVQQWGTVGLLLCGKKENHYFLWYEPSAWIDGKIKDTMPVYVDEMDATGNVLNSFTLPPQPHPGQGRSWGNFLAPRLQSPAYFFGGLAYQGIGGLLGSQRLAGAFAKNLGHDLRGNLEIISWIVPIALLLAGLTLYWARRVQYPWPCAWAWAAFVFGFGLPGLITFRLAADWPQLVSCPQCGKPRPTHEAQCPGCHSGWPTPRHEVTDIFDRARSGLPAAAPA